MRTSSTATSGSQSADRLQRGCAIAKRRDDGHVRLGVDDPLQGVRERWVVVRDDDPGLVWHVDGSVVANRGAALAVERT